MNDWRDKNPEDFTFGNTVDGEINYYKIAGYAGVASSIILNIFLMISISGYQRTNDAVAEGNINLASQINALKNERTKLNEKINILTSKVDKLDSINIEMQNSLSNCTKSMIDKDVQLKTLQDQCGTTEN